MAENDQTEHKHIHEFIPAEAREHAKAARAEMRKSFSALFPPQYITHRRAARKEMLLAAREIINHALERMETPQDNEE
jgi:hypothetical protein